MPPNHLPIRAIFTALLLSAGILTTARGNLVTLSQDNRSFILSNGRLTAAIDKQTAAILRLEWSGIPLLGKRGSGYWSLHGKSDNHPVRSFGKARGSSVVHNPGDNGGQHAEIAIRFHGNPAHGAYPGPVEVRYALRAEAPATLFAAAILGHAEGNAPFDLGEGRFVLKLAPELFDWLVVDPNRTLKMPTGADWDAGRQMNLKEARLLKTGEAKGRVEHKYAYSATLSSVPAYGWVANERELGVWMLNPSLEFIAGGPTKVELTGHLDTSTGGVPTLLNMWHGSHYGGAVLRLAGKESWHRVVGPFAIHINQGGNPTALQKEAEKQAAALQAAWPFSWFQHPEYPPAAARGTATGVLRIEDPAPSPSASGTGITRWVGLTQDANDATLVGSHTERGWQRDGKFYQYWVQPAPDGTFAIPAVRPGRYVLRAFADGHIGEFQQAGIHIKPGPNPLGQVVWKPERMGPILWEIGIPDRKASEFRNGGRYWQWGNYFRYRTAFPDGVNYVVGQSDWREDWHLCHPLDLDSSGKVRGGTTWTVRFPVEKVPADGAVLRIGFCGTRGGTRVGIKVNGKDCGNTGPLPESAAMHRDSDRALWFEHKFAIPARHMKTGENILGLHLTGRLWHQGVLYDYLRMEAVEGAPSAAPAGQPTNGQPSR